MKIFISWSGNRSKFIAEGLKSWLKQVIQATEPWISIDIDKGSRWSLDISNALEESSVGIICLDKSNLNSNWILFEAGALSKMQDSLVCTLLLDLKPTDIEPPLSQFQTTSFNKKEIKELLFSINERVKKVEGKTISNTDLEEVFNINWPKLESVFEKALISTKEEKEIRTQRELVEEILRTVREIQGSEKAKILSNTLVFKSLQKEGQKTKTLNKLVNLLNEIDGISKEKKEEVFENYKVAFDENIEEYNKLIEFVQKELI